MNNILIMYTMNQGSTLGIALLPGASGTFVRASEFFNNLPKVFVKVYCETCIIFQKMRLEDDLGNHPKILVWFKQYLFFNSN